MIVDGLLVTDEELAQAADLVPHLWVLQNELVNESGQTIEFEKRKFLKAIYDDLSPKIAIAKPPQIGATVMNCLKAFYVAHELCKDLIYTLPTQSDVQDIVGGSFNRIIAQNAILQDWVHDHDTVEQKSVGSNLIRFRGTFSSKQATMVPSSGNIHDEVDSSDPEVLTLYQTRQEAQEKEEDKWSWYFSHPSLVGHGVDIYMQKSDYKEWHVTCDNGHEEYMTWPDSVDMVRETFICRVCKTELSDEQRINGRWKNKDGIVWSGKIEGGYEFSGWHISQLHLYNKTAKDIIKAFNDPQKDKQYFYNYVLGLPYIGSEDRIEPSVVLRNCVDEVNDYYNPKDRVIIGCDTGHGIHYVLRNNQGVFLYGHETEITATKDPYDKIAKFLDTFDKSVAVFDQGGDLIGVRKLQAKYPGRVFLVFYRKDRKSNDYVEWGENDEFGTVRVDRNRQITIMVEQMRDIGRYRLNGSKEDWAEYASHFGNLYREKIEIDSKPGKDDRSLLGNEYIWKRNGADHYCIGNGAEVPTRDGIKKIEDIKIGDMVVTRKGYRRVEDAFMASANAIVRGVVLSNGNTLWATPDHKVYVADREWTTIDNLRVGDKLITWQKKFTESYLTASSTADTQTIRHETSSITPLQVVSSSIISDNLFIKKCGSFIKAQFQRVMLFTTLTVTHLITRLKISLVSQEANITAYTPLNDGKTQSIEKECLKSLKKPSKTRLPKPKIENNSQNFGVQMELTNGAIVLKQSSISVIGESVFNNLRRKILSVLDVALKLIQTLQEVGSFAPKSVEVITVLCDDQPRAVYDLTVEGEHEYFANGILVSNCHAQLYCDIGFQHFSNREAKIFGQRNVMDGIRKAQIVSDGGVQLIWPK